MKLSNLTFSPKTESAGKNDSENLLETDKIFDWSKKSYGKQTVIQYLRQVV